MVPPHPRLARVARAVLRAHERRGAAPLALARRSSARVAISCVCEYALAATAQLRSMSRRSRRKTTVESTMATQSLRMQVAPEGQSEDAPQSLQAVAACASSLGLNVRPAALGDVHRITQAHTRFEMEMAEWAAPQQGGASHIPDGLTAGIRQIIQDEGGDRIMLLTRELADCAGGGEVIGFVYSCDEVVRSGTSCYIAEVFVEPSERGQGLGDLLVAAALASALSRGTRASHLYVCHRNAAAVQLYEKHGFESDGDSGDPTHDLVMVNAAVSPDAVRDLLEQRQARKPKSRRARGRSSAAAAPVESSARRRTGGASARQGKAAPAAPAASAGGTAASARAARAARARARQDSLAQQTTSSSTRGARRQPCADLAENVALHRGAPENRSRSDGGDELAGSARDPEAAAAVSAPKPKLWVRPRPESPAGQPTRKKVRRQTTAGPPERVAAPASGAVGVFEEARLRATTPGQGEKLISLSGFGTQPARLAKLESIIIRLGGQISRGNCFDSKCTHVVVSGDGNGSLRRTEKMLGALASGRPLLTEKFLDVSDAAGSFVEEDRFECRAMFPSLLPIERAPCFSKVCAAVLAAGDEKRLGLQRILQVRKTALFPHFLYYQCIILPRQARTNTGKALQKAVFSQAGGATIAPPMAATSELVESTAAAAAAVDPSSSVSSASAITHIVVPPGGERDLAPPESRELRQLQRQDGKRAVVYDNQLVDYLTTSGGSGGGGHKGSVVAFDTLT